MRTPITLKIKFKSSSLDQFIERYSVDVSRGGIFIRTKEPLPIGTQLRFEFQLQDASSLIAGEGTVTWLREPDPARTGVAPGMGVRFDKLATESAQVLERILSEKTKRGDAAVESRFDQGARASQSASGSLEKTPARGTPVVKGDFDQEFGQESTRVMQGDVMKKLADQTRENEIKAAQASGAFDEPTRRASLQELEAAEAKKSESAAPAAAPAPEAATPPTATPMPATSTHALDHDEPTVVATGATVDRLIAKSEAKEVPPVQAPEKTPTGVKPVSLPGSGPTEFGSSGPKVQAESLGQAQTFLSESTAQTSRRVGEKSSSMPIIIGAVLVLGGIGAYFALRGGGEQAGENKPAPVAPKAVEASPSPSASPSPVEEAPKVDASQAAVVPAKPVDRSIDVVSEPAGALLFLDGKMLGRTPHKIAKIDTTTEHALELRKPGFQNLSRPIVATDPFENVGDKGDKQVLKLSLTLERVAAAAPSAAPAQPKSLPRPPAPSAAVKPPVDKPADKPAEEKPAAEKPAQEKTDEKAAEKPVEKPADKPAAEGAEGGAPSWMKKKAPAEEPKTETPAP